MAYGMVSISQEVMTGGHPELLHCVRVCVRGGRVENSPEEDWIGLDLFIPKL